MAVRVVFLRCNRHVAGKRRLLETLREAEQDRPIDAGLGRDLVYPAKVLKDELEAAVFSSDEHAVPDVENVDHLMLE